MSSKRMLMLDKFTEDLYSLKQYAMFEDNQHDIGRMKDFIRKALQVELTPRQRQCLIAYYFDGKKMSEIAQELQISTSAVSRHVKRAVACLRARSIYY